MPAPRRGARARARPARSPSARGPPAPWRTAVRTSGAAMNRSSRWASWASSPIRRSRRRCTSPRIGLVDAGDDPEQGRLAGAVRAPQGRSGRPPRSRASMWSRITNVPISRTTPGEPDDRHQRASAGRGLAGRGAPRGRGPRVRSVRARRSPRPASPAVSPTRLRPPSSVQRRSAPALAGPRSRRIFAAAGAIGGRQALAPRAEVRGADPEHDPSDRPPAARAGLAGALVDLQALLHRAVAVGRRVVVDRGAAERDGLREHVRIAVVEPADVVAAQRGRRPQRVQARPPERLVGVDVADPREEGLVREQRLEPPAPAADLRAERLERERADRAAPARARTRRRAPSSRAASPPATAARGYAPTRPNLRMSRNRSSRPSSNSNTRWTKRSSGASAGTTNSWPVIFRWTAMTQSPESSSSRSFARRPVPSIVRPTTAAANASTSSPRIVRGQSQRTSVIRAPATSGRRSRATVSTSGSSGIAADQATGDAAGSSSGASSASASTASRRVSGVIPSQSSPTLTSTVSGTSSGSAALHRLAHEGGQRARPRPVAPRTAARRGPRAAAARGGRPPRSRSSTRIIAIFTMSAAVPWIGMLIAIRSPAPRRAAFAPAAPGSRGGGRAAS